jgi:citrate lyase subunit beta/citryl-CoA lyase
MRLRRTLLWVPGNRWEKICEAINTQADCLTLDLEDSVPVLEKEKARETVLKALKELDFQGKEKIVRINPVNTVLGQTDIQTIIKGNPDAIRLPKCENLEYVLELDRILSDYEKETSNSIKIILMIETPLGIRNAYELATCTKRIVAIGLGAEDLTTELKTSRSTTGLELELMYARQKLMIDGRAAGVDVIDSSCLAINNLDDLRRETEMIKQMGFDGKSVAHESQVTVVNDVFNPSQDEINYAQKVMEFYTQAEREGSFQVFLEGKMIDVPVVRKAHVLMERAKAAGLI